MIFCHLTILIIISNLAISQCMSVTYKNVDYNNHKIQNNQTRKLNEYHPTKLQTEDIVGNSSQNSTTKILRSNKLDYKSKILDQNQLLKYLRRYPIHKKNSPYTMAIFKSEKSKERYPSHTLAIFKQNIHSNDVQKSKEKFPSHTLAIFEPNPDSNPVVLSKPYKINLTEGQFILPEIDEDTREGEVLPNDANTYQVDDALKQEYYTIDENEIYSFPSDDSSYFPDSYKSNEQYQDNFTGYPESHQLTSTTEQSSHFDGYSYQAPTYLPPVENTVVLLDSNDTNFINNDIKVVKTKDSLFSYYYLGYRFWYGIVVFLIYHVIMIGYFYLVLLVKHYSKFPAALQAAIANSQ